jgi:hypothetical protein
MKVIIAGSRDITDHSEVSAAIRNSGFNVTEVVSGRAPGVDSIGEALARLHGMAVKEFPADWNKHGRAAGPIRNRQMAEYADALIAVWDGQSRGTKNMIETMKKMGKKVYVHIVDEDLAGETYGKGDNY